MVAAAGSSPGSRKCSRGGRDRRTGLPGGTSGAWMCPCFSTKGSASDGRQKCSRSRRDTGDRADPVLLPARGLGRTVVQNGRLSTSERWTNGLTRSSRGGMVRLRSETNEMMARTGRKMASETGRLRRDDFLGLGPDWPSVYTDEIRRLAKSSIRSLSWFKGCHGYSTDWLLTKWL